MAGKHPIGKYGALIAALLPVAASVYHEGQTQHTKTTDQLERQRAQEEQRSDSNRKADSDTAKALQDALRDNLTEMLVKPKAAAPNTTKFCSQIYFAAAQLQVNPAAEQTNATLLAAFNYRTPDGLPAVCACGADFLDDILREWSILQKDSPAWRTLAHDRAAAKLNTRFLRGASTARNTCDAQTKKGTLVQVVQGPAPPPPRTNPPPPSTGQCKIEPPPHTAGRVQVFLQIPDDSVRDQARKLQNALNQAKPPFEAPGIERVGRASPDEAQVRYFYPEDRAVAVALAKSIEKGGADCGLPNAKVEVNPLPQFQGRIAPGVLEVWFPKNAGQEAGS